MFNNCITKRLTFAFFVKRLFDGSDHNPPNIKINIIQIECLHKTKFFDQDHDLDCKLNNFAPCKCIPYLSVNILTGIRDSVLLLTAGTGGELPRGSS